PGFLSRKRIVVLGGGISGLSAAHFLRKKGFTVRILERSRAAGGTIQTVRDGGWLVETGPNSALETTPLFREIFDELGLTSSRLYADPSSSRRYIIRGGKLHALPMSPVAFLRTRLWTLGGRMRLLKEPFVGRGRKEESIAEFVTRRLG